MKIGIDARFYRSSTGGIGRYTRALIKQLSVIDKKNDYYIFITPEDEKEYGINEKNFKKVVVDIKHYSFSEQTDFLKILNSYKLDLVHFTNFNHPVFYKGNFVVTVHDLTLMMYPDNNYSFIKKLAFNIVMKNSVLKSKVIIADSLATKKDILNVYKINENKIKVVYIGLGNKVSKEDKNNKQVMQKYSLDKPYLLFVSQWRPHKGIIDLVKSFEILKEKYKIPHKLFIGGMPIKNFPNISEFIKSSKYVSDIVTPGFINDKELDAIFNNSEAFIFPSHYEGFGLPPLEAMQRGVAVASSNLSCMPEVLGDAAVYFNPNNHEEMSKVIFDLISDKKIKSDLIKRGLLQVKKYSWKKMAEDTLKIYEGREK